MVKEKNMGAKITTEIDPYIKQVFEGMRDVLGLTYKDILEEGILAKIKDVDPVKAEEIEIMRLELELSSHKMQLATLRVSSVHVKEITAKAEQEKAIEADREKRYGEDIIAKAEREKAIEADRERWFKKRAAGLAKAVDGGYIVWSGLATNGLFESPTEVRKWILNRLPEWRKNLES